MKLQQALTSPADSLGEKHLVMLPYLPHLTEVSLEDHTGFGVAILSSLNHPMPFLKTLQVEECMHWHVPTLVAALKLHSQLTKLTLCTASCDTIRGYHYAVARLFPQLPQLPHLQYLNLTVPWVSVSVPKPAGERQRADATGPALGLRQLSTLTTLTYLSFDSHDWERDKGDYRATLCVAAAVSSLRNLRVLDLAVWRIKDVRIARTQWHAFTSSLSLLTHLNELHLSAIHASEASSIWIFDSLSAALPDLVSLRELTLQYAPTKPEQSTNDADDADDAAMLALCGAASDRLRRTVGALTALTELGLSVNETPSEWHSCCQHVSKLSRLRKLSLEALHHSDEQVVAALGVIVGSGLVRLLSRMPDLEVCVDRHGSGRARPPSALL
jgi:hypothetical protein